MKTTSSVSYLFLGVEFLEQNSLAMANGWHTQSCINESREDINGLTREEKKYFFSPMSLSSSVIRIVHAMI